MTDAQVGQYIRLMCLQHQKGHLSETTMKQFMGGSLDDVIASKFVMDENGRYYNERLETEINKRNKYTESRKNNLVHRMDTHMAHHMDTHMGGHMENENRDINDIDKGVDIKPIKHKYGEYNNVLLTDTDLEKLKAEYPDEWAALIERLSSYIASTGKVYKNHLATMRNWMRRDKERKPNKGIPCNASDYKEEMW